MQAARHGVLDGDPSPNFAQHIKDFLEGVAGESVRMVGHFGTAIHHARKE